MVEDLYLLAVVARHRVEEGPESTPEKVRRQLGPALRRWGGQSLEGVTVAGSYAKGTAIRGVTLAPADVDVDLFLGLAPETPGSLEEQQEGLARQLGEYRPLIANVAVKILVGNQRVDLTVGRRAAGSRDHTLWQHRKSTWIRTNVAEQIRFVCESGRREEILALKIWRRRQGLYFPSFCLELAVIEALSTECPRFFSGRFLKVLGWLEGLPGAVLRDPANKSNLVSELMTGEEKWRVANAAWRSRRAASWTEVV